MQDNKQPNQSTPAGSLRPDIVKEIPVATPDSKLQPVNEDDELDNIMRDVGHDLKQVRKKPPKRHWFGKPKPTKIEPRFSARPIEPVKTTPVAPPAPKPVAAAPKPAPNSPQMAAKPVPAVKPKPVKTSRSPIGVVILTMLITVGLIAAAFYAYK